ncbi:MAG: START-like domain-containing protein [Bacteroidota bacterium]
MAKHKFVTEFEINASKKMLYPYIYTPSGLAAWFADDVNINEDKVYNIMWDGEDHLAKMASHRTNGFVKFEFLPETDEDEDDPSYLEFRLDINDLTQTVFLRITDYSENDDDEELQDIWESMVLALKETVGG